MYSTLQAKCPSASHAAVGQCTTLSAATSTPSSLVPTAMAFDAPQCLRPVVVVVVVASCALWQLLQRAQREPCRRELLRHLHRGARVQRGLCGQHAAGALCQRHEDDQLVLHVLVHAGARQQGFGQLTRGLLGRAFKGGVAVGGPCSACRADGHSSNGAASMDCASMFFPLTVGTGRKNNRGNGKQRPLMATVDNRVRYPGKPEIASP